MPQATIVCPSGLAGEVRNLKGREAEVLSDKSAVRTGAAIEQLLSNCWLRTDSSGLYTFSSAMPEWQKVYQCDRFFVLLQLRALTYGDGYVFPVKCKECEERFDWEMLISKLVVRPLSDKTREALKLGPKGNRFEATVGGVKIVFRLLTGKDEKDGAEKLKQLVSQSMPGRRGKLLQALALKIVSIEGVEDAPARAGKDDPKVEFLRNMDMPDLTELSERMEEVDGGVETTIDVFCPHCDTEQQVDVPFAEAFWTPKRKAPQKPTTSES